MAADTHVSFLRHRGLRDLKLAALLCVIAVLLYALHDPVDGPNGGTWLGYGLGGLAAAIILLLSWLGVRKRRYAGGIGQVKGWLSAHVYLGLALTFIATLHTGFQFGWNVHTLAYALMLAVILSGVYGVWMYGRAPQRITQTRNGQTREAMLEELDELNHQSMKLADTLGTETHRMTVRSVESLQIGGGVMAQLFGPEKLVPADFRVVQRVFAKDAKAAAPTARRAADLDSLVAFLAEEMIQASGRKDQDAQRIQQLLDMLGRRTELAARINRDIRLHARMQIWLYLHVPLTLALLVALLTHVISVFLYW